eukprot:g15648.t1
MEVGLIYLNPEGPVTKQPDAKDIRDAFGRMGMNDSQTVALIGGGHTFGKSHGACPEGPGPAPNQDVHNPWPGKCGTGKGNDTFTSGMEGPWTTKPTEWDNEFFVDLLNRSWELIKGPGGHWQWQVKNAVEAEKKLMRLTSDMALIHDDIYQALVQEPMAGSILMRSEQPEQPDIAWEPSYRPFLVLGMCWSAFFRMTSKRGLIPNANQTLVPLACDQEFALNMPAYERAFDEAWFKLTTNGGRWSQEKKCIKGEDFPVPQRSTPRMRYDDPITADYIAKVLLLVSLWREEFREHLLVLLCAHVMAGMRKAYEFQIPGLAALVLVPMLGLATPLLEVLQLADSLAAWWRRPPAGIPALPPPSAAVDLRQDQGRRLPLRVAPMEVILEGLVFLLAALHLRVGLALGRVTVSDPSAGLEVGGGSPQGGLAVQRRASDEPGIL